jgi:hypothetical protein
VGKTGEIGGIVAELFLCGDWRGRCLLDKLNDLGRETIRVDHLSCKIMKFRLSKKTITLAVSTMGIAGSHGAVLWTNPITGTNPNTSNPYTTGQTVIADISVSGIGRGDGITGTNANDRYNANSWNTATIDLTAFFTFTLTPGVDKEIDFTNFIYSGQASGTGATSFSFRSSIDGFSANIGTPTSTGATINLTAGAYQGISAPIEFRLYGWGASASTGTFSVNDFTFNGEVVPEPTSALLGSLGLLVLLRRRRY